MNKKITALIFSLSLGLFGTVADAASSSPIDALRSGYPALYKLYNANQGYQAGLSEYAGRQGFRRPYEQLATVVHEMVHIASAVHQGFFIDGVYYEPYLSRTAWPALTNNDVRGYMLPEERGVIYTLYVQNTPSNTLGNVVDEINAYSHVAGFICKNEPESGDKQVKNLTGHLHLQEAYLRVLRLGAPQEYAKLTNARESRGALYTITTRAWQALRECGVPDAQIPSKEAAYFFSLFAGANQAK